MHVSCHWHAMGIDHGFRSFADIPVSGGGSRRDILSTELPGAGQNAMGIVRPSPSPRWPRDTQGGDPPADAHRSCCMARHTRSAVKGERVIRTPTALKMALEMTGRGPLTQISLTLLAP